MRITVRYEVNLLYWYKSANTDAQGPARHGQVGVIALFLFHGLKVDTTDHEVTEWTSIHHACCAVQTRVVEFLVERKARANANNKQDDTPLHLGFGSGNMEFIRLLM